MAAQASGAPPAEAPTIEMLIEALDPAVRAAIGDVDRSYFHRDSYNDLPILERVGTTLAVNADARLRRYARRRGWATPRWH
jgi:phosphoserine phosphatase